jgi:hypothetical protein
MTFGMTPNSRLLASRMSAMPKRAARELLNHRTEFLNCPCRRVTPISGKLKVCRLVASFSDGRKEAAN